MKKDKKTFLKAMLLIVATITLFCAISISCFAADASATIPGIEIKDDFNANQTIRTIFNWIIAILAIVGVGVGGIHIVFGQINQDNKERNSGIATLIVSLSVGGLMLLILNMILV